VERDIDLTCGPARLCDAFGLTRAQDGARLYRGPLRILAGIEVPDEDVATTIRVGIRKAADWPLRFLVRSNPFVSRG
jgi:DNA-3-methyladenine glycosylase